MDNELIERVAKIRPGMRVRDIGCGLTRALRESGFEPPPRVVTVLKVYDWGFWVIDPARGRPVYTCEHWEVA